ncbi:carbohydrate-binding protein [Aquimarina latercula]|uniref:carbohydrate-binding protein n=1 Tax=Aquimarina latercula TaxID=987 RepID=UPI00054EF874|nr:carbohydrate-binding protein [Aquimarina latercula]
MKRIFTLLITLLMTLPFFAQSQNIKPKHQITSAKLSGKHFEEISLFNLKSSKSNVIIPKEFKNYSILSLRQSAMKKIGAAPEALNLQLPSEKSSMLLELVRVTIVSDDFSIVEMPSGKVIEPLKNITHYRGIVKNSPNSIAAITIKDGEISGIISLSDGQGNLVLAKLDTSDDHILYEDKDINHLNDFVCQTENLRSIETPKKKDYQKNAPAANQTKCPEIFFDIGNDIVRDKGGSQAASNYIQSIFNQVAILYNNEGIKIKISGIRAWTSSAPFNNLDNYRSYRNQNGFNGDLGHFVTYNYSGGVAWLNGLCGSYRYGLSGINRNYSNVPVYSWTVNVIAHELGHNFGSNHTHSCVWNGNNTAIDGCYNTEGSCGRPGIPSNGGTTMSYCHLTSAGINLSKGFGNQPADAIRRTINRANCVDTCNTDGGGGNGDEVSCAGIDEWSENVTYVAGDKVTYQGNLFERTTNNDWNTLGVCSIDPCFGVDDWNENTTYSPGDLVIYQGNLFRRNNNQDWDSLGSCENNDPCFGVDDWNENTSYAVGDKIIYQGNLFEWTANGWEQLASCSNASRSLFPGEVDDSALPPSFSIYPNPASDVLNIEANNSTNKVEHILIRDINGRVIKTIKPKEKPSYLSFKQSIVIDELVTGVYFIQIINADNISTKKFFVQ